jgi:hypothetical protein
MGSGYINGLLAGFRERGDQVYQQSVKDDLARKDMEGKVFEHLLASRDPEIRALALQGIYEGAQPSQKKKGWRGFLGEIQQSSTFPQIQSLANELVPAESHAPTPALGQSAAMSTNAPVSPGSAPITQPSPAPMFPGTQRVEEPTLNAPQLTDAGGLPEAPQPGQVPMAPQEPPEIAGMATAPPMRKRGTQVPTAEEIAEYQARIPLETRIGMAKQYLPPEMQNRAVSGILGAPTSSRNLSAINTWGVKLASGQIVPVLLDQDGGYKLPNGDPIPPDAQMVRMGGSAGGGGLSSYVEDVPEQRAQLQAQYPGIQLPPGVSPTGFLKIQVKPDGSALAIPAEFTPPPQFTGTTEVLEPGTGVPVRQGVNRRGGTTTLGDAPRTETAKIQQQAQGLLAAVDKLAANESVGAGGGRRRLPPTRLDQIVKEQAKASSLPYQTYTELQQAAKVSPDITPRQEREQPNAGMSMADKVRAQILQDRQQGKRPSPMAAPPPPAPSVRSQGPGPRK